MTTLRKVLPFVLIALVALWTFTSYHGPTHPQTAFAQSTDCSFTFTFTGAATQTAVSNLSQNTPCVNWRLTLSTTGTLSATVTFQTSPDNAVWTAVPNTVCSSAVQPPCVLQGANPIVGTQGMLYAASYGAYVRVVVTLPAGTGTGTVRGYGAKGATANVNVSGPAGVTGPTGPAGATGPAGSSVPAASNLTPVTVSANTAADQTLQEVALSAGALNTVLAANLIHGSGRLTIGLAQTPTLTFKTKLCTVSGCGSGTVVTLASIVTAAAIAATNNGWNLQLMVGTVSTGATGTLEVHGAPGLVVDIGALPGTAATPYTDTNTAVSSAIDLTAALFVDFTVATSVGSALNSITQDIADVLPQGAGGGALRPTILAGAFPGAFVIPSTTAYYPLTLSNGQSNNGQAAANLASNNVLPVPFAGTLSALRVTTSTAQPGLGAVVFSIAVNGAGSALSISVSASSPSGLYSDLVHTVPVNAGDLLSVKIQNLDTGSSSAHFGNYSFQIQ